MSQTASTVIETSPVLFDNEPLPDGWRWVRLGDISEVISKGTTPTTLGYAFTSSGVPFLRAEDVNGGAIDVTQVAYHISNETHQILSRSQLRPGDLLITIAGTLGRVGYVPINSPSLNCNQAVAFVRLNPNIVDVEYACFACQSEQVLRSLTNLRAGGIIQNLNLQQVQSFLIPLPPLPEQRRITSILNEQMAAVERARAAAEAQLKAAKDLPATYLREVFNSEDVQQWETKPLGEVGEIVSGVTLGRKFNPAANLKVPYLRVANVKDGHLDLTDVYEIEATPSEIEKLRIKFGDLLLTEGGDPDKLGRGTFWEEQLPLCIHQNHIFRVRFNLSRYSPPFVSAQVGSPYGKAYFLAHAKQTTGIATINQHVLSKFPLLSPSLSEQTRIALMLNEKLEANNQIISILRTQLDTIEKIPAALLRQAFAGKL